MKLFGEPSTRDAASNGGRAIRISCRILAIVSVAFTIAFCGFYVFSHLVLGQVEGVAKQLPNVVAGAVNQPGTALPTESHVVLNGERVAVLTSVVHMQTAEKDLVISTYRGTWTIPADKVPPQDSQYVGLLISREPTMIRLLSAADSEPSDGRSGILLLAKPNRAYPMRVLADTPAQ